MYNEEVSKEVKKEYFEMNLKTAEIVFVEMMSKIAGMYLEGFGVEKILTKQLSGMKEHLAKDTVR